MRAVSGVSLNGLVRAAGNRSFSGVMADGISDRYHRERMIVRVKAGSMAVNLVGTAEVYFGFCPLCRDKSLFCLLSLAYPKIYQEA